MAPGPVSRRPATRTDHDAFCRIEGWAVARSALGKPVQHHATYTLALADGRILRTRVSRPPDRTAYGPSIWAHILHDQLDVSAEEFWACVEGGIKPARSTPVLPVETIPASVVAVLLRDVRLSEAEVAALTRTQAIARAAEFWTTGR